MAVKVERPDLDSRVERAYFARNAVEVAKELLGKTIVRQFEGSREAFAMIREVVAWQGEEESSAATLKYAPGMVGISKKMGHFLIDIATGRQNRPSCVTLVGLYSPDNGIIQGPGNVSTYLHVDDMLDSAPIDHPCLWIGGESVDPQRIIKRNKTKVPSNCRGYFYFKQ